MTFESEEHDPERVDEALKQFELRDALVARVDEICVGDFDIDILKHQLYTKFVEYMTPGHGVIVAKTLDAAQGVAHFEVFQYKIK